MDHRAARIKDFVARMLSLEDIGEEEDVFKLGLANSLFALQLVAFVEMEFEVVVKDDDLTLDNFRTIAAISRFIARKSHRTA